MEQVARPKQIRLKGQRGDDDLELKLECIKRVRSEDVPVRVLTKLYGISYSRISAFERLKRLMLTNSSPSTNLVVSLLKSIIEQELT